MANFPDLGAQLTYAAGAVPAAYPATTTLFHASATDGLALWVKFTTDAATNFTSYSIKLQGSYDGVGWADLQITDQGSGTTSNEITVTVSAGNGGVWRVFETTSQRFTKSGCQILLKGNGGAVKAGDAATVYVEAW